jgi:hypothetical protein
MSFRVAGFTQSYRNREKLDELGNQALTCARIARGSFMKNTLPCTDLQGIVGIPFARISF